MPATGGRRPLTAATEAALVAVTGALLAGDMLQRVLDCWVGVK